MIKRIEVIYGQRHAAKVPRNIEGQIKMETVRQKKTARQLLVATVIRA